MSVLFVSAEDTPPVPSRDDDVTSSDKHQVLMNQTSLLLIEIYPTTNEC